MFDKNRRLATTLVATLVLVSTVSCYGPRYLSEPPPEFYEYVDSLPTPRASTPLADKLNIWYAPRETCTTFDYVHLYGTNEDYSTVQAWYEQDLVNAGWQYVKMPGEFDATLVLGEFALVSIAKVSASDRVALLDFGQETLDKGQASFKTLFIFDIDYSYGNCKPHPNWPE